MSSQSELSELLSALEELSPDEVRYVCVRLGVEECILNKIDADHQHESWTRITKYLTAWLDRESRPSWAQLVQILKSRGLNKSVLASKIWKKYCSRTTYDNTTPSPLSNSVDHGTSDHVQLPALVARPAVISIAEHRLQHNIIPKIASVLKYCSRTTHDNTLPSLRSDSVDQGTSDHVQQCSLLALAAQSAARPAVLFPISIAERDRLQRIPKRASVLEMNFLSVLGSAKVYLINKKRTPEEFQLFKIDLTHLPLSTKYKRLRFLKKKKEEIMRAESIREVFDILDPYWNYIDYSLLGYVVKKYCDKKVQQQMRRYNDALHEFERATSVKDFTSVVRDHRRFPREIAILTAKLNIDAAQCSLYRMRKIKESINERASLQPYVTLMRGLHTSSVVLKLAFPHAACKYVKKSLGKDLFQSLGIIPESVDIQLSTSYGVQKKSHMHATAIPAPLRAWNVRKTITTKRCDLKPAYRDSGPPPLDCEEIEFNTRSVLKKSHMHATAMPDPPQNVREELSYTIKRCDLKPVYRDSGPQRMRKYCDEIELKTSNANICIEIQWEPVEVDFHVVGLEKGVTTAMNYIQKEFLSREKVQKLMSDGEKYKAAPLSVDEQRDIKAFGQRNPVLLTEEALREHERLTLPKELRQFACRACKYIWWRVVLSVKAVSRCKHCNVIYNALPCNKEYGIGRFICPDEQCGNVFFGRCHAKCKWKCYGCETVVSKPYIHPGNEHYQTESMCHGAHYCRKRECLLSRDSCARMLFTSTPHVSTGSTINNWFSQTRGNYPFFMSIYDSRSSQLSPTHEPDYKSCYSSRSGRGSMKSRD